MENKISSKKTERILGFIFILLVFAAISSFAVLQPFGDPPDEINRYKVAQYICVHGTLPNGADPEIAIGGYGASYAFQPILPYMIQGYAMRIFFGFTQNYYILTYVARFVNVLFGVLMAVFVRKIAKEAFDKVPAQWLFTLLVVFLPQNLFLHSYVNTDSMAALSAAIIIYASLRGLKDAWKPKTCITLAVGIIFCALSYYNAYGVILSSILLFIYSYLIKKNGKSTLDWKPFLQKGCFIAALVLVGIGWWFIRNAILYDGDFLGMAARSECAVKTALPDYNPLTKMTIKSSGKSIFFLLFNTEFVKKVIDSTIAMFSTMNLETYSFVYSGFKFIFAAALLSLLLPVKNRLYLKELPSHTRTFFNAAMLINIIIPILLCIWYSYSWDYQPQGRYILPLLIPFMYFVTVGFTKLQAFMGERILLGSKIGCALQAAAILFIIIALAATILGIVIPHYLSMPNWLDQTIQSFHS